MGALWPKACSTDRPFAVLGITPVFDPKREKPWLLQPSIRCPVIGLNAVATDWL
jgi:hypothetical protein